MPRLSDSMEEATIVAWHVADGALVEAGQELAEVETDKATVSFEAEHAGAITLLVQAGETVPLGAVVARIDAAGEEGKPEAGEPEGGGERPRPSRPAASPLARRVANQLGVDLAAVDGSGPRGRIVKRDVERIAGAARDHGGTATPSSAPAPTEPPAPVASSPEPPRSPVTAKGEITAVELSRTQQVIARRMSESRATVPDFTVSVDVDMEAAWGLRLQLKEAAAEDTVVPSLNDLVVLACGRALREQPEVNSAYADGGVERFERVNVGVAIAAPGSLVVATVFDADRQSLGAIAGTTRRLAGQVRDGTITPPDLAGATFTVSNLGMFGVERFTAVVNLPQAAILAVGAMKERPVVHEGNLVARRSMTMTLSADHRVLYGADAARFLTRVGELLEQPLAAIAGT